MWRWVSTMPRMTMASDASISNGPAGPSRPGPTAAIVSPSISTSASVRNSCASFIVRTVPRRSTTGRPGSIGSVLIPSRSSLGGTALHHSNSAIRASSAAVHGSITGSPDRPANLGGVIDLHLHLLPGVDDGPADEAASLVHAEKLARDGVHEATVTPHVGHPDLPVDVHTIADRTRALQQAIDAAGIRLRLHPGGEIFPSAAAALGRAELELVAHGPPGARCTSSACGPRSSRPGSSGPRAAERGLARRRDREGDRAAVAVAVDRADADLIVVLAEALDRVVGHVAHEPGVRPQRGLGVAPHDLVADDVALRARVPGHLGVVREVCREDAR